jgi:hypothetical protein
MRLARGFVPVLVVATFVCAACGSYDTGIVNENAAEHACLDVIDTFARTAERCGGDYATEHDRLVQRDAKGDCKNVRSIRDETALRDTCIPFVKSQSCSDFTSGKLDPSCAEQLQRSL